MGERMEYETCTVSQITAYISQKFKFDTKLKNIYIEGEISNLSTALSGHVYFTLKDEKSQISAMLSKFNRNRFPENKNIENGMKVIVKGKIDIYDKQGKYQLYATKIIEYGTGNKHKEVEELKKKLKKEGLFDPKHKKSIPKYPKRIGVVTAKDGAAVRDVITTIRKKYSLCEIIVFPTLVQGDQAPYQITRQIKNAQNFNLDTLIVGRGGGSFEDLMAFNEEIVARAIFNSEIPVISAVGHEIDHSISDLVADLRAPTPTAAGELAVPDLNEMKSNLNHLNEKINQNIEDKLNQYQIRLSNITSKQIIKHPETIYEIKGMNLDSLVNKLSFISKDMISKNKNKLFQLENSYILKNPTEITKRKKEPLNKNINKIRLTSQNIITQNKNKLFQLENSYILKNPGKIIKRKKEDVKLNETINKLNFASNKIIAENKNKLFKLESSYILKNPTKITKNKKDKFLRSIDKLDVLNPLLTLKRGYSITKSKDKVISSAKDVKKGDELEVEFDDGKINTKVI